MDLGWIDRLDQASNTDLFRLRSVIDRKLEDPKRILSVRKHLRLGQSVRFVDWRNGDWRTGTVLALRDRELTLRDDSGLQWKLPYVAIEPPSESMDVTAELDSAPPVPRMGREDFAPGDRVSFTDKYLQTQMGTVLRINQRTATIACEDGQWRVGFSLLRHVIDL